MTHEFKFNILFVRILSYEHNRENNVSFDHRTFFFGILFIYLVIDQGNIFIIHVIFLGSYAFI